jgi:cytochrome b561
MTLRDSTDRYDGVTRALHWSIALLLLLQVAGGLVLEELPRKTALRAFAFDAHESVGIVVLALIVVRIGWRLSHAAPPAHGPAWQRVAARGAHLALYALMVAIPVIGYAMVDAKGYDVAFFGATGPGFLATDKTLADRLSDAHEMLAWALVSVVALHVAAALWHRFVVRDEVMARMLPAR